MSEAANLQQTSSGHLVFRQPAPQDGSDIYALVKQTATLDVNSEYVYLLLGAHFQESCTIAVMDNQIIGFVSAYIPPKQPDVLFVWQVAVDQHHRQKGLALAMLQDILARECCQDIKYIHATIADSNKASRRLFMSLARELASDCDEHPFFAEQYFSQSHEAEPLFIVGPLSRQKQEGVI